MVLDEPTNDLDVETLELLEDILSQHEGTILLVSHDREFLNNVVTSTIAFEGQGKVREYVGGYEDWIRQGGQWDLSDGSKNDATQVQSDVVQDAQADDAPLLETKKKLSYKLQRELNSLPAEIEKLEQKVTEIEGQIAAPDFYQQAQEKVNERLSELSEIQSTLEVKYARWDELEAM